MNQMLIRFRLTAWILSALCLCSTGIAQPTDRQNPANELTGAEQFTIDQLQQRIDQAEVSTQLDDETKAGVIESYKQAISKLQQAQSNIDKAKQFQKTIETGPAEINRLKEQLAEMTEQQPDIGQTLNPDVSKEDIEQQLSLKKADAFSIRSQLDQLDQQLANMQTRPTEARNTQAESKNNLEQIERDLKLLLESNQPQQIIEAERAELIARRQYHTTLINMLEQEILSHNIRFDLATERRNLLEQQMQVADAEVRLLEQRLQELQQAEAIETRKKAEATRREAIGKHPAVQAVAEYNADLGKELPDVIRRLEKTTDERANVEADATQLKNALKTAKQRLEIAGMTSAMGQLLRNQQRQLVTISEHYRRTQDFRQRVSDAGIALINIEDRIKTLEDMDAEVSNILQTHNGRDMSDEESANLETQIRQLLNTQLELLNKLHEAYTKLLKELGDLDFAQSGLVKATEEMDLFLKEQLLWIPSHQRLRVSLSKNLKQAIVELISPSSWRKIAGNLVRDIKTDPFLYSLVLIVFAGLLVVRPWFRRRVVEQADQVGRVHLDKFQITTTAFLIALICLTPWPMLLWFLGTRLTSSYYATQHDKAVGASLVAVGIMLILPLLINEICRKNAIGEKHFRWQPSATALTRYHLRWFLTLLIPCVFIVEFMDNQSNEAFRSSLGRLVFIIAMFGFSVFFLLLFRPSRGIIQSMIKKNPNQWLLRFRMIWYPFVIALPLGLIVLTSLGYYYTSNQLIQSLAISAGIIFVAMLIHELVIRWLLIESRRIAYKKALEKRDAMAAREDHDETSDELENIDLMEVDLQTIQLQTRRLLNALMATMVAVGVWIAWADVLPALNFLEEFKLWTYESTTADGQFVPIPITLQDLFIAIFFIAITWIAARNLPGFLEITILKRIKLETGMGYAITTLCRYIIVTIGIVIGFHAIGIGWSQVQFIVAAIGVGLGFGLQEIFANFVSGLIIFFDRRIRLGDTVTVEDVTGKVSKIRILATTIIAWDRKEFVVPNKDFVTGRILNWTLTDSINRIIVNVGIAYGSDTDKAYELLLKIAKEHPLVLDDPEPVANFDGFGDSTLNFVLRCFISKLDDRLKVMHELHTAVDKAFRKADIEIAFPQRDLHLRSVEATIPMSKPNDNPQGS